MSSRRFLVTPAVQPESRVMKSSPPTTGVPWGRMCVDPVTRRNLVDVFELRISSSEITRSWYQVSLPGSMYSVFHFPERAGLLTSLRFSDVECSSQVVDLPAAFMRDSAVVLRGFPAS